jgi:hypothetical protein
MAQIDMDDFQEKIGVQIKGNVVGSHIINECIDRYKEIKESEKPCILQLIAEDEITEFDHSIIGHFILFREEYSQISIQIKLEKNNSQSNSIAWKLRQQMIHAYYNVGEKDVFTLFVGQNSTEEKASQIIKHIAEKHKGDSYFALSKKFLPVIFLNDNNYNKLFQYERIDFELPKGLDLEEKNSDDSFYKACRTLLFDNNKNLNADNYLQMLVQLAFHRSLEQAKMLRYYWYDELDSVFGKKEKMKVGRKTGNKDHWEELKLLFDEIKQQAPINILLFFSLISSDLIFKQEEHEIDIRKEKQKIKNLWEFTKELVYGIKELAKNIIEHADKKNGILVGFVNNQSEFELSVFDHGEKGIMKTFMDSLVRNRKEIKEEIATDSFLMLPEQERQDIEKILKNLENEIESIRDGEFQFKFFFDIGNSNSPGDGNIHDWQTYKAIAHTGILVFTKMAENLDALTVVSTNKEEYIRKRRNAFPDDDEPVEDKLPHIGTYYRITLQLDPNKDSSKSFAPIVIPQAGYNNEDFLKLEFAENFNTLNNNIIYGVKLPEITLTADRDSEEMLWKNFRNLIPDNFLTLKEERKIIAIDFLSVVNLDDSQLFRFLGKFELWFPQIQLIVYNINTKKVFELKRKNDYYFKKGSPVDYWNKKKATLIYSYIDIDGQKEKRFYFTDILWGETEEDFKSINNRISFNHFNATTTKYGNFTKTNLQSSKQELPEPFFDKYGNLLALDLLITDFETKTSLYNYTVGTLLQNEMGKEVKADGSSIEKHLSTGIKNLQAYKLPDSHFRLGSKIHISDFYYTKPFFQNSYFAKKYALLLAYEIIRSEELKNIINKNDKEQTELSLIGYGLYSELLVCYVKEFLDSYYESEEKDRIAINCNTVNDAEECGLNRPSAKIHDNVIIIVPIATTFSTSLKIASTLRKKNQNLRFLQPYLNVLLVVDRDSFKKTNGDVKKTILKRYSWNKIDKKNKTITIKLFDKKNAEVKQKYFLHQTTTWSKIKDCKYCFPDAKRCSNNRNCFKCDERCVLKEKPLFDTDKTSLAPELVLEYPKVREIHGNTDKQVNVNENTIIYGHLERNSNHYHYYFDDYNLWNINSEGVKEWLLSDEVKKQLNPNGNKLERIVILAPGHCSNTNFVAMVNEVAFANRATILHYDHKIENTRNFQLFYGKEIENADKVYFVDDAITSGSTFIVANSFLRRIRKGNCGFDACLFFVNRAGFYEYKDICRKLGNKPIYAYTNLHIPNIKSFNNNCPLCNELEKYKILYKNSYHTIIKLRFLTQQDKLQTLLIDSGKDYDKWMSRHKQRGDKSNKDYNERTLKKAEAVHRIYDWFSDKTETEIDDSITEDHRNLWLDDLISKKKAPFRKKYLTIDDTIQENLGCILSESYISMLKVLTQAPFYSYKTVREKVFNIVVGFLNRKVDKIYNDIKNNAPPYDVINEKSFKELKFLIRRACTLNSNYIISYKMLGLLRVLYNKFETSQSEELRIFASFFMAQINELLHNNEARSIELKNRLIYFEKKANKDGKTLFKQLIRMIREENGAIIRTFTEFFTDTIINKNKIKIEDITKSVTNELKILAKSGNFRYKLLKEFLSELPEENKGFLEFLELKTFLAKLKQNREEKRDGEENTEETVKNKPEAKEQTRNNIQRIFQLLHNIMSNDVGCFAIVKYKKGKGAENPYFLLYNEGAGKDDIEKYEDYIFSSFLCNSFLEEGEDKNRPKSIVEYGKDDDGVWKDLYADKKNEKISSIHGIQNYDRLLLLRIDRDKLSEKDGKKIEHRGQAVVAFYFNANRGNRDLTELDRMRYLLMLREDISDDIRVSCETDEFRDLIAEKIRLENSLTSEHDYNKILNKMSDCRTDDNKFTYLYSLLDDRETLKKLIIKSSEVVIENDDFNIENEINKLYQLIFEREVKNKKFTFDGNKTVSFPLKVFRAIMYEYLKNANSYKSTQNPTLILDVKNNNDSISMMISNNASSNYDKISPFKDTLEKYGYAIKKEKGLYKNKLLLDALNGYSLSITFTQPDEKGIYDFVIKLTLNKYEKREEKY